jgi:serine/threonine protein kinase
MEAADFFTEYGEANRYTIKEVIGKGSYGVVCSANDNLTGETVMHRDTDLDSSVAPSFRAL